MPENNKNNPNDNAMNTILQGMIKAVQSQSKIKAEQAKLQGQMLSDALKGRQNFMQQVALKQTPSYGQQQYEKQQGGAGRGGYEWTPGGTARRVDPKEQEYKRITTKPEDAWTPEERSMVDRYRGYKTTEPTWSQQQRVESVRTGLGRGEVVIGKEFGEPSVYPIKSLADAHKAIGEAGLDPSLFKEELAFYENIANTGTTADGRTVAKMKDGKVIYLDTREEVVQ